MFTGLHRFCISSLDFFSRTLEYLCGGKFRVAQHFDNGLYGFPIGKGNGRSDRMSFQMERYIPIDLTSLHNFHQVAVQKACFLGRAHPLTEL